MIVPAPACMTCLHYHREGDPLTCDAFPERIPDAIWLEGNRHTSPVAGDHGIRYEPGPHARPWSEVLAAKEARADSSGDRVGR